VRRLHLQSDDSAIAFVCQVAVGDSNAAAPEQV
jgi:hypothetical protein